jgi:cytidylate kinase
VIPRFRILILGNSGSGKSWLAERLASMQGIKAIDLDSIHWEPGGYNIARDKDIAVKLVRKAAEEEAWVIEGVYGWLIREAIPRANLLIWLDVPVSECLANLRQRGLRRGGDTASFEGLLTWTADYPNRHTSSSFVGHEALFTGFQGQKARLCCRGHISEFLRGWASPYLDSPRKIGCSSSCF